MTLVHAAVVVSRRGDLDGVGVEDYLSRPMYRSSRFLLIAALLAAYGLGAWRSAARADEPDTAPHEGVLVLRNQNILEGQITQSGGFYFVASPSGQARIPANQVEMACSTLDEAYQRKQAAIHPGDVDGHLQLAEWCLRQDLIGYAAEQILQLRRLNANRPRLPLLERQLELQSTPPPEPTEASLAVAPAAPDGVIDDRPTRVELDQMIKDLPRDVVARFTAQIQPIIVNRCALAGCHGPGAQSEFHIERLPITRNVANRMTQRNLYAVLREINRQSPTDSPLIARSMAPHGKLDQPVFGPHDQTPLRELAQWVYAASQPQTPPATVSLPALPSALLQSSPPPGEGLAAGPAPPPADASADDAPPTISPIPPTRSAKDDATPDDTSPSAARGQGGASPAIGYIPRDPFDPDLFNRLYGAAAALPPASSPTPAP